MKSKRLKNNYELETIYNRMKNFQKDDMLKIRVTCIKYLLFFLVFCLAASTVMILEAHNCISISSNKVLIITLRWVLALIALYLWFKYMSKTIKYETKAEQVYIEEFLNMIDNNLKIVDNKNKTNIIQSYINSGFELYTTRQKSEINSVFNYYTNSDMCATIASMKYFYPIRGEFEREYTFKGVFAFLEELKIPTDYQLEILNLEKYKLKMAHILKLKYSEYFNERHMEELSFGQYYSKFFKIYSNDKDFTLRIFNEDTIKALFDIHEKYNTNFEIIIRNSCIYIRIVSKELLTFTKFGHSLKKGCYRDYMTLKSMIEIINVIKNQFIN